MRIFKRCSYETFPERTRNNEYEKILSENSYVIFHCLLTIIPSALNETDAFSYTCHIKMPFWQTHGPYSQSFSEVKKCHIGPLRLIEKPHIEMRIADVGMIGRETFLSNVECCFMVGEGFRIVSHASIHVTNVVVG